MNRRLIGQDFGPDYPNHGTIKPPLLALGMDSEPAIDIVQALLDADWPVYAVARAAPELRARLAAIENGRLSVLTGQLDGDEEGAALAQTVRTLHPAPGAVLVMSGTGFPPGRLLDHDTNRLRDRLEADVLPHLVAARHLLPVLAERGRAVTWLALGGPAAEAPWAGYGHMSVSSAALRSLVQVLREETRGTPMHVRQLSVCTPIRTVGNRDHACSDWPNAIEVAHRIGELLLSPPGETVACMQRRLRPAVPARRLTSSKVELSD